MAFQGTWMWQADHDLDGDGSSMVTVYSGRGLLSESQGPVWLVGTGGFRPYDRLLPSANLFIQNSG